MCFYRVVEIVDSGQDKTVVDPTKDQLFLRRRQLLAAAPDSVPCCSADQEPAKHDDNIITIPTDGWEKDLELLPYFCDINIQTYCNMSGKMATNVKGISKTCIRPETRGYQFYVGRYIHDIWCQMTNSYYFVKCKSFRSQSKSSEPHSLWVCLPLNKIECHPLKAYCTCVAGASGFCNHIVALLYQISHYSKSGTTTIPDDISKTSVAQAWDTPRIEGIAPEPVMQVIVKKAKLDATKSTKSVECSLYEARSPDNIANVSETLTQVKEIMCKKNPLYGFSYMVNENENMNTEYVKTTLGTYVPTGSLLSYQLALSEGNFHVQCDNDLFDQFRCMHNGCVNDSHTIPVYSMTETLKEFTAHRSLDHDIMSFVDNLCMSISNCKEIERKTQNQSSSNLWWSERKYRFTASDFGELCKRKKKNCDKLVERKIRQPVSSSQAPASLRHGKDYEDAGARKYLRYMTNIGHKLEINSCGLVLRSDMPILGCSPDRIVMDPLSHPHIGVVEIKCPYTARAITPRQAAMSYPDFCCEIVNGNLRLKRGHNYYYQVQGQMAITGVQWCDFVLFTFKGMFIERIGYDESFWTTTCNKLTDLYLHHFVPAVLKQK